MHDSVIRVEMVLSEPRGQTFPIKFAELSGAEQSLLQPAVTHGGVGFCVPPDSFRQFLELAADRVSQQQEASGPRLAFLQYRDRYYGLYIEQQDQVYSSE